MGANKYRGEVSIRLDRVRTLKFTFNAFAEFESLTGKSIQQVFQDQESLGFGIMRQLLWAGLYHEDKALTVDQAGDLMEAGEGTNLTEKLTYVTEHIVKAVQYAFSDPADIPDDEDEAKKKPKSSK